MHKHITMWCKFKIYTFESESEKMNTSSIPLIIDFIGVPSSSLIEDSIV